MNSETNEISIQNEISSQSDQITQIEEKSNEISQSDLLQSPMSPSKEEEQKNEAKLITRLKEIDEILEKGLKFFKFYNWMMITLIILLCAPFFLMSITSIFFGDPLSLFYTCSGCLLFQSQHILNILAIQKKNSSYANYSMILTSIKTVISLITMMNFSSSINYLSERDKPMDDRFLRQLSLVIFVISVLSFISQVLVTLPRSYMLEKLLSERAETQRKLDLKNITSGGYVLMPGM